MPIVQTTRGAVWYADHRRDHSQHPPLLLIHGAAGTHLDWSLQLRRINAVVPDLPGHGKSDALPSRDRITDYAGDIIALLDALDIQTAIIVGQSMGGAIAQTLALQTPARVAGLILIGTGAKLTVHPRILDYLLSDQPSVGELFKSWMWADAAPQRLRELGYEQFMRIPAQVAFDDYTACQHFDSRDQLRDIHAPALIFGATEDQMTPLSYAVYLHEHLPDSELVTVEHAGHLMQLEQPQLIADEVKRWLATHFPMTEAGEALNG